MAATLTTATVTVNNTTAELLPCEPPKEVYRKDYKPAEFTVLHCNLDLALDFGRTDVHAKLTMKRRQNGSCDLILHGSRMVTLLNATVDGKLLTLGEDMNLYNNGDLQIKSHVLPGEADKQFLLELECWNSPEKNHEYSGLYKSGPMLVTQCEAEGFRNLCYYLDRPDVMAKFDVRLEAEKSRFPILLSNGERLDCGDLDNGRHFTCWRDPWPKPSYLFGVVAGDLAKIEDKHVRPDGSEVQLILWSEPVHQGQLQWAMESLKKAMKWDEDRWGRMYDLPLFNVVVTTHFNFGAMENKSLNIFNSLALLAHKDLTQDGTMWYVLGVVGHEYFHNWSGNRVTCRDWFQLTLKEGLTVFRDFSFQSDMISQDGHLIKSVLALRHTQFAEDRGALAHSIRPESYQSIDNFYTATVYEKGCMVIRMCETILGKNKFRQGLDLYFDRHDGQAVTCDDFLAAMADASKVDLTQFAKWYEQCGTPIVTVLEAGKGALKSGQTGYRIKLKQDAAASSTPLHMPFLVGLINADTGTEIVPTRLFQFTEKEQTFEFEGVPENAKIIPSLFRRFSAPIHVDAPMLGAAELAALVMHDTDSFNRFDAASKLMQTVVLDCAGLLLRADGKENNVKADCKETQKAMLKHEVAKHPMAQSLLAALKQVTATVPESKRRLLVSWLLMIPSVSIMMTHMTPAHPAQIGAAAEELRQYLASNLADQMRALYNALSEEVNQEPAEKYEVTEEAIGTRSLRNRLLWYLVPIDGPGLAKTQYYKATNMTAKVGPLFSLCELPRCTPERQEVVQDFIDKAPPCAMAPYREWIVAQVGAPNNSETLEIAKELWTHPKVDTSNQNLVRALLKGLAENAAQFHRDTPDVYNWVADRVVEVDKANSLTSSFVAKSFVSTSMYDEKRRSMLKDAMYRMLTTAGEGISTNLKEVITKGLQKA